MEVRETAATFVYLGFCFKLHL